MRVRRYARLAQPVAYDVILRGGRIVDGTGSPWYRGDVAFAATRSRASRRASTRRPRGSSTLGGLVVAPGFIDIHTHARRGIFEVPTADNYVRQGVTTLIEGPDGVVAAPAARRFSTKVAGDAHHAELRDVHRPGLDSRRSVMGQVDRRATPAELDKMRALVQQGMEDGAFGLSSGLFYVPGTFTPTAEVVELAKVAGRMGGIYISHMRDEASRVLDSVRETIAIGEQGGLPTQVTHHKSGRQGVLGQDRSTHCD